jgi:hypothetical protein
MASETERLSATKSPRYLKSDFWAGKHMKPTKVAHRSDITISEVAARSPTSLTRRPELVCSCLRSGRLEKWGVPGAL